MCLSFVVFHHDHHVHHVRKKKKTHCLFCISSRQWDTGGNGAVSQWTLITGNGARLRLMRNREHLSVRRFIAVLGEIHVHSWGIIVVRHGGHVYGDFFCFLFTRFAVSLSSSNLFFSSFDASFDPLSCVSRDLFTRASRALGPSEGASLMHTHFSK